MRLLISIVLVVSLTLLGSVTGCARDTIIVSPEAPIMLAHPVEVRDPFVRIGGEWVQKKGRVVRPAGQAVLYLQSPNSEAGNK